MCIFQQPKGLPHRSRGLRPGYALGSRVKTSPCPEGARQIDGYMCGAVRMSKCTYGLARACVDCARSLVRDSCKKVLGMPISGRGGFVDVLTEGVALVYDGAARWAAHYASLFPSRVRLDRRLLGACLCLFEQLVQRCVDRFGAGITHPLESDQALGI